MYKPNLIVDNKMHTLLSVQLSFQTQEAIQEGLDENR